MFEALSLFALIASITYAVLGCFLALSITKKISKRKSFEPKISIIVAARNEAQHLPDCLRSLLRVEYPPAKTEIIVVDDCSTDDSEKIIQRFATAHPQIRHFRLEAEQKHRPGKAGAILYGIDHSSGEIIFITDADCQVPPTWIRGLLQLFTERVGLVGGFTLLDQKKDATPLLGKIQSLDWLYLLSVAAGASTRGRPLSWVGNNMAFRRQAYDKVGGYRALGYSLIEDFALANAIATQTDWQVRFSAVKDALVHSSPLSSLLQLYRQRRRWFTGFGSMRPFGKSVMILSTVAHLSCVALSAMQWQLFLFCFLSLALTDWFLLYPTAKNLDRRDLLRYFPAFQFYFFCYLTIFPLFLFFDRQVVWKEQRYPSNLAVSPDKIAHQIRPTVQ